MLEDRFGLEMDEADITLDVFGTVGSLARYLDARAALEIQRPERRRPRRRLTNPDRWPIQGLGFCSSIQVRITSVSAGSGSWP